MFQAIKVKYLGCTNTLGARYKATAAAGSVTVPRAYTLGTEANHIRAAQTLCDKFGWSKDMVHGALADGSYAFVLMSK